MEVARTEVNVRLSEEEAVSPEVDPAFLELETALIDPDLMLLDVVLELPKVDVPLLDVAFETALVVMLLKTLRPDTEAVLDRPDCDPPEDGNAPLREVEIELERELNLVSVSRVELVGLLVVGTMLL